MKTSDPKRCRILVVDDEKNLREMVSQMVIYAGFDCHSAASGEEALQFMRSLPVDIMITDIIMPGMDGIQLTRKAKKEFNIDVIVMAGFAKDYSFEQIIEKGADDFIEKPIRTNELVVRLKRLLKEREILNDRNRALTALKQSEKRLRAMAIRLQEVQEELRKELARELHDRLGQNLAALNLNLNIIKNRMTDESLKKSQTVLDDSMKLVVETTGHFRDVMANLRPVGLDEYGLIPAIRWYARSFSSRTGISVQVHADDDERLAVSVETELFRITQEAFTNILKYADADLVKVFFKRRNGNIRLAIRDNGKGFDPKTVFFDPGRSGWGLLLMKERVRKLDGKFSVSSMPGKGTTIEVYLHADVVKA